MEHKVVLVTGASSGIGAATAAHLAHVGYRHLALVARREDKLVAVADACTSRGATDVLILRKDLTVVQDCIQAIQETVEHFGRLDVLISNAGVLRGFCSVRDISMEDFQVMMDLNVRSAFLLTKAALPHLEQTKGCILYVSSVVGHAGCAMLSSYSASKAALNNFARCVALEEASKGIRVNTLCPGAVITEMAAGVSRNSESPEEGLARVRKESRGGNLVQRAAEAEEMASLIAFLISDENKFMVGSNVVSDGGFLVKGLSA